MNRSTASQFTSGNSEITVKKLAEMILREEFFESIKKGQQ